MAGDRFSRSLPSVEWLRCLEEVLSCRNVETIVFGTKMHEKVSIPKVNKVCVRHPTFLALLIMVLRMLTTFAKTANVSNKPGLTLENAGDYRGALRVPVVETSGGEAGETVVIYG